MKTEPKWGPAAPLADSGGFALLATLLIMSLLTVIGLAAIKTTGFELGIARNGKTARVRFLGADSGWQQAGPYLNGRDTTPPPINLNLKSGDTKRDFENNVYYKIVRNFGNGTDGVLNDDFQQATKDGQTGVPYWYRVIGQGNTQAVGFDQNYLDYTYEVVCNAGGTTEVDARVKKVYRTSY
ncbi:MAG: pilus assembly PilX N-terminal domain-containing protein [Desulfobacter sp.]|nr:MAG: pilus assembly PilX N-terminal domain-containing protein [Desulfobacter sp.]